MPNVAMSQSMFRRHRERGQTIIVALIILGVLLILGFIFLGIINRAVGTTQTSQNRTAADDLANAGIRYAHQQLLNSPDGADWRGRPTPPILGADPNFSNDPDANFLRQAAAFVHPSTGREDLGGPDGLGPFIRVNFDNGRALVRVRYAPSDPNIFENAPAGALRNPGVVRSYLIIESVGRRGRVVANDPTIGNVPALQVTNFTSAAQFTEAIRRLAAEERNRVNSRRLTAFASTGLTDSARFITNKYRVSRAVDIGVPRELGTRAVNPYDGTELDVASLLVPQLGLPSIDDVTGSPTQGVGGLGSFHANADLMVHGNVEVFANASLGDRFTVAGTITGAPGAALTVVRREFRRDPFAWLPAETLTLTSGGNLDSRNPLFSTAKGVVLDGIARPDLQGFPRGVGYKVPPTLALVDPETNVNRYVQMTRESGLAVGNGNSGRFGHGRGIYVDNAADRQTPVTEAGRRAAGAESLVFDWLNPNNPDSKGWQGPFYVPVGAQVQLLPDGFVIGRDSRAPADQRFWRNPDGSDSGLTQLRYRLGIGTDGQIRVVSALTPGISNIDGTLASTDYDRGPAFTGVLYFEGNVRVRGVIPTDAQLSLVSNATIYIEGSITKGVTGNALTGTTAPGQRLNRPSRSMLALMARDYVAVNTTAFFGPSSFQNLEVGADAAGQGLVPVRVKPGEEFTLNAELTLERGAGTAFNPGSWNYAAANYRDALDGSRLAPQWMFTHASADGPAERTFIGLTLNRFTTPGAYLFPNQAPNAAAEDYGSADPTIPLWGLGLENYQRFPKYEALALPLFDPTALTVTGEVLTSTGNLGTFSLVGQAVNSFSVRPESLGATATNDYLLARAALAPHDVVIEALVFAEEGAFFVIPGPWFNPNPSDNRAVFQQRIAALQSQGQTEANARLIAQDERRLNFGSSPVTPFYGEPLDVKVRVNGAIVENLPPAMAEQAEWLRKWGWIPARLGGSTLNIPASHVPAGQNLSQRPVAPNLTISMDPVLATGRTTGFANPGDATTSVRRDEFGRLLPPIPRLPVSPALTYFGDVNP
jgi:type II secretory pathway pseudopilin PulG